MSSYPRSSTSHLSIPSSYALSLSSGRAKSPTHPVLTPANTLTTPLAPHRTRSHSAHSQSLSHLHAPLYSPQGSSTDVFQIAAPKRLLMPTVRSPRAGSPRIPSSKQSPAKHSRSRASSASTTALAAAERTERASSPATADWVGGGRKFEIVEEQLELEGYQIYAVEKWVVERRRPVTVLTVFTGDPTHKITVTALSPCSTLSQKEAQSEWEKALKQLRREGARPKETDKGMLMVTSLANFRSDYTIVHIPRGNFLDAREQLYTNINILRMGCSGRSALTLEEPSDATKDRFISIYNVPDKASARSRELFNATVLELVKLVQSALAIFDMFDLQPEERNGLLCDVTCDGIKWWVTAIGEPCMKVEPMERVADPTVVAALFSLILSIRNKLHALGHVVPKDPFVDPQTFTKALTTFLSSKPHGYTHSHTHTLSPTATPFLTASPNLPSAPPSTHTSPVPPAAFLTQPLIKSIQSAYDKKMMRQNESYKVHRVLINKLDDLKTDLRTSVDSNAVSSNAASNVNPTTDLSAFVKVVVGGSKDAPQCLRYLWTGRPGEVGKKRREKEAVWSDAEREREEREREKEGERANGGRSGREKDGKESREKEKGDRDKEKDKDVRSSDDDDDLGGKQWSGRVQRKIESWAALGRTKKMGGDFGTGKSADTSEPPSRGGQSEQSSTLPSVIISRDPEDAEEGMSSGQMSPASGSRTPSHLMPGLGSYSTAARSTGELSDHDRRVNEFNHKRPSTRPTQSRITSWSDPVSARGLFGDDIPGSRRAGSPLANIDDFSEEDEVSTDILQDVEPKTKPHRRRIKVRLVRRHSFGDASNIEGTRVLPLERMRIDVDLCGQLLVMQRREAHLANVAACLEALAGSLSRTNSCLRQDHESARSAIDELRGRAEILHDLEVARSKADALTQETNALEYESAQFLVDELWHMAAQPRQRVFALREKAFGTGRRHPHGVRNAHGLFNRVQWTLDGRERLVDRFGRTESEAEEEEGLPPVPGMEVDEEAEDVDAVEHQTLRPTWLLRFFNYWGSRWGASKRKENDAKAQVKEDGEKEGDIVETNSSTTSLQVQDADVQPRLRPPLRNYTS